MKKEIRTTSLYMIVDSVAFVFLALRRRRVHSQTKPEPPLFAANQGDI